MAKEPYYDSYEEEESGGSRGGSVILIVLAALLLVVAVLCIVLTVRLRSANSQVTALNAQVTEQQQRISELQWTNANQTASTPETSSTTQTTTTAATTTTTPEATPEPTPEPTPTPTPEPTPALVLSENGVPDWVDENALGNVQRIPKEDEWYSSPGKLYVTAELSLRLRSGPSSEYGILTTVPYKSEVTVYAEKGDWRFIKDEKGNYGWASITFLSTSPAE